MSRFFRLALGFYLLATSLGLVLRLSFVQPVEGLNYSHALHAHSHTLYFGWAGLALFALAFQRLEARGAAVWAVLGSIAAISLATFLAFLHGGYSRPAIIVSSISLGVWFSAAGVWWRRARGRQGVDLSFFRAACVYLLLAGGAAMGRVVVLILKVQDPFYGRLAVFGFLHCFAGFFILGMMGMLAAAAPSLGVRFDEGRLSRVLRVMAPLAWITFPLGVPGGDAGMLGLMARGVALVLLYPGALWVASLWQAAAGASGPVRTGLRWLALWFVLKMGMEAGGALGLAGWAVRERHPSILFIHVQLLGVITGALLLLMLPRLGRALPLTLSLHNLGLAGMSAGLGLAGLARLGLPWLMQPGLFLAVVGGAGIVLAAVTATLSGVGARAGLAQGEP